MKFSPEEGGGQLVSYNRQTTPRLQEGPQCGLVALAMAGDNIDLEQIVRTAKERGYTKQGEMFSVEDMASLARKVLKRKVSVVSTKGDMKYIRDSYCVCCPRKFKLREGISKYKK